jgi:TFIIH basal transcription factor complex TTD-A subunit
LLLNIKLKSDSSMRQFLLYLDENRAIGEKFVIEELDDTHLFVDLQLVEKLKEKIDELMDKLAYRPPEK